jgi:hypothetical protein
MKIFIEIFPMIVLSSKGVVKSRCVEPNGTTQGWVCPLGKIIIDCCWVFCIKYKENDMIKTYKIHLATKGYFYVPRIDFIKTFSCIMKMFPIQVLLALDVDYEVHHMDIKIVFLSAYLEEKIT